MSVTFCRDPLNNKYLAEILTGCAITTPYIWCEGIEVMYTVYSTERVLHVICSRNHWNFSVLYILGYSNSPWCLYLKYTSHKYTVYWPHSALIVCGDLNFILDIVFHRQLIASFNKGVISGYSGHSVGSYAL